MLQYLDKCRKELDEIQFADDTIARLTKELDKARKEADRTAQALSQQRRKAAEKLGLQFKLMINEQSLI